MDVADVQRLREGALSLLRDNLHRGYDPYFRRSYTYICPARRRYHWQWFWDSCFHAIALSRLDPALAKQDLLNLVAVQEDDGLIGHIGLWGRRQFVSGFVYLQSRLGWRPHRTALIQPPVIAYAAWRVFQADEDRSFLQEMAPRLNRYYRWLAERRDPDGDGLIAIITPYESGLDHSPAYDPIIGVRSRRPSRLLLEWHLRRLDLSHLGANYNQGRILARGRFVVEDVLVNCVYAEGLRCLAELNRAASDRAQAELWDAQAERVEAAIVEKCYDPGTGLFFGLEGPGERKHRIATVVSLMPLILKSLPEARAAELVGHLHDPNKFWLPYPVPSVACDEPTFEPRRQSVLWRGPTWLNTNWFLMRGLRLHGYGEIADIIARRSAELVLKEGFREYYDPLTGRGLGAKGFGWSTLVVDMV